MSGTIISYISVFTNIVMNHDNVKALDEKARIDLKKRQIISRPSIEME